MNIPIRPGYYSKLDMLDGLHEVDEVPAPHEPLAAALVSIAREAQEREQRELREQRRAERKVALRFYAAVLAAAGADRCCEHGTRQGVPEHDRGARVTPRQWRWHHLVTHIMLAALLAVWGLLGFGAYKWVRS